MVCLAMLLSGLGLLAFEALGTSVWHCPFKVNTGLPCPGCGFTRGTIALLSGDWRTALAFHPFTPLIIPALLILIAATALPEPHHGKLVSLVERIERKTGIALLLVVAFIAYGVWRIADG